MSIIPQRFDLSQIPFIDRSAFHPDRVMPTLQFYVNETWRTWLPVGDTLQRIQAEPRVACYWGDRPAQATDQNWRLLDVLAQCVLTARTTPQFFGLWNDYLNLAASMAKLGLFYETHRNNIDVRRFVQTEIEYIVVVCRSIFDLLQEIVVGLFSQISVGEGRRARRLRSSFDQMVSRAEEPRSAQEIAASTNLPLAIAEWYVMQEPFFTRLRRIRNRLAHGGNNAVDFLFCTDRGFGLTRTDDNWNGFFNWPTDSEIGNRVVPLRPMLASVIQNTINACESFASVMQANVGLPAPLIPGLRFYSRGQDDVEFARMQDVIDRSLWCDQIYPAPAVQPWFIRLREWFVQDRR